MTKPEGLFAIEREMARQGVDALATLDAVRGDARGVAERIRRTGRVVLLGMGASHAANRAVEPLYRGLGLDAVALPVSEQLAAPLPLDGRTVLLSSQSGESAEVARWLATARGGAPFGLTLDPASTLAQSVPSLIAAGGPERAFAATRSLTLTLALHLAILAELGLDPQPARAVLAAPAAPDVSAAVAAFAGVGAVVASGRRLQGLAEAAALGLCELSRMPAFAIEGGQLRHGPMEIMGPRLGVLLLRGREPDAAKVAGMAASAREAGSPVVLLDASGEGAPAGVAALTTPPAEGAAALFAVLPNLQRFMLGVALARVADVGTPMRSAKITRTE